MSYSKITVALLLVVLSAPCLAVPCHKQHSKILDITECLMAKESAAEKELNKYLALAQKNYSDLPKVISGLNFSQKLWATAKDKFCMSVYEQFSGGTGANPEYVRCTLQQTERRTHDLWQWYLTHEDSTPPDLPEPKVGAVEEY